jgi:hypothetical protein
MWQGTAARDAEIPNGAAYLLPKHSPYLSKLEKCSIPKNPSAHA